jgi:hypothetical protein
MVCYDNAQDLTRPQLTKGLDFLMKYIIIGKHPSIVHATVLSCSCRGGWNWEIVSPTPLHTQFMSVTPCWPHLDHLSLTGLKVKDHSQHTIGVEFSSRTVKLGEKRIKLQVSIWFVFGSRMASDLPHCSYGTQQDRNDFGACLYLSPNCSRLTEWDPRCSSVTRSYYRGAAGAILVYDITKCVSSQIALNISLIRLQSQLFCQPIALARRCQSSCKSTAGSGIGRKQVGPRRGAGG